MMPTTMEHDGKAPSPFGLPAGSITECLERAAMRPSGMTIYEAFAYQLEAEISNRMDLTPGMLPLLREFTSLRRHADNLAQALEHSIGVIKRNTPLKPITAQGVLDTYKSEVEGED